MSDAINASSPAVAPPPGNPRFELMDAARGVAATLVVVAHSSGSASTSHHPLIYDASAALAAAVQLFFALSGFLLFRPFVAACAGHARWPRAGEFLRRRALRIIPAYWFALLAVSLVLGSRFAPGALSGDWWRFFGFLQVYSLTQNFRGLGVAWSLCVEVSFYLVLPVLALAARAMSRRWGWRRGFLAVVAPLFVLGPIVRLLNTLPLDPGVAHLIQRMTYTLPGQSSFFAMGMLLAVASVHRTAGGALPRPLRTLAAHPVGSWLIAVLIFAVLSFVVGFPHPYGGLDFRTRFVANTILVTVFVGLILMPLVFDDRDSLVRRAMRLRPVAYTGVVSYGLYLWHVPILVWLGSRAPFHHFFGHSSFFVHTPVIIALGLGPGLLMATISYRFVELPFLRRKPGFASGEARRPTWSSGAPKLAEPGHAERLGVDET